MGLNLKAKDQYHIIKFTYKTESKNKKGCVFAYLRERYGEKPGNEEQRS